MELAPAEPERFAPFVRDRFSDTDRGIDEAALERLLELTAGHPYATQQLCYFLWEELPEGFMAGERDLERALGGVLAAENAHFDLVWEQATRNERLLLLALGREPGRPYSVEYRRRHGLSSSSHAQRSLRSLQRRELVRKRLDGSYELAEPFLPAWLERL